MKPSRAGSTRMDRWAGLTVACLILAACAAPLSARASVGVGTDTGKITVPKPLSAGSGYDLPAFKITNPGDQPSGYVMDLVPIRGSNSLKRAWFTFAPAAFYLYPGQAKTINVSIALPSDASPGAYRAILVARPAVPRTKDTPPVRMNLGAGPTLVLTIVPGSWFQAASVALVGHLLWISVGAALLVVAVVVAVRVIRSRWTRRRRMLAHATPSARRG